MQRERRIWDGSNPSSLPWLLEEKRTITHPKQYVVGGKNEE